MASNPESMTPNQLKLARIALWHQDGDALRTLDDARGWLESAGLVPYYPHAQFAASPQPSFAEAILGRPENGWVPKSAAQDGPSEEESYAVEVEDEEPEEGEESDFDSEGDEEGDEDFEDAEGDEEEDPAASDDEVMLTTDDEMAEDEGDEIAEEDRIHAGGDPTPNDLKDEEAADAEPEVEPINGFTADEKEVVSRTLARMVEEGSAVPLNLLGSTTGEPDFVCSAQAFSFVYTLRGDKNFKNEPATTGAMRVSPLAVKVYEQLKEGGAQAPHELSTAIGQGVVDSAILRSLSELWAIQRVLPVPDVDGGPAKWELMTGRFVRHLKAGANAGQPTALSALLSLYLSQAVAATSDEMEIFLSPLAARSRVREVVGGLSASRQLDTVVMDGKSLLFMPGALDELPADTAVAAAPGVAPRSRYEDDDRRHMIEERAKRFAAEGGAPERRSFPVRRPAAAGDRPARREGGFAPRREGGFAPRSGGFTPQRRSGSFGGPRREGGFAPRAGGFAGGRDDRERRPFVRRDDAAASETPRNEFARPWDENRGERKPFTPREGGERRPFTPREGGDRRPFTPRSDRPFTPREGGERKPFTPREGGERRPFTPRDDRPFTPREGGERRPFTPRGDRPFTPREGGDRRPFTPREGGDRRPFTPRVDRPAFGDRKPFVPRGDRPFTPRGDRPFTPRGDRPFTPREGGERRPFTPREGGERRPFTPREGGDRRPFTPRGDRPFTPREGGDRKPFTPREGGDRRPFTPRGDRPFTPREGGERRPFTPREGGSDRRPFTPRGDRPFTPREGGDRRPFTPRGDRPFTPREGGDRRPFTPREGGRPFTPREGGRPSFGDRKSSGPGGAKFGGSGFGRDRNAGSFGKPGGFPPRRGPGNGPGRGGAPKRRPE